MQFSFRPLVARQLALAAGALSLASFLTSCDKNGGDFDKTKSGIEYKIFKSVNGKYERRTDVKEDDATYKDRVGKFLTGFLYYRTGKDSILADTRKKFGSVVPIPLQEIKHKGMQDEAFSLLQPGDSAVFRFNADSLSKPQHQPVPGFLKRSGNVLVVNIKTEKLISREEEMAMEQTMQQKMMEQQQKQMQAYAESQNKKDEVILQDYLKKNNLTAQAKKTPGGVYYIITQPGTGALPKPGQEVSLQYRGTLLDGKEFDASAKHGKDPFKYVTGRGQVIPGWDEGVAMLNKGAKATLLIPSSLAYGERGAGADIPANSPLRFDVELVNIQDAKATPGAPAAPAQ